MRNLVQRASTLCLWPSLVLSIACSASPEINVGNEFDGSVAGASGASGSGGTGGVGGFGGGNGNALIAHIEEPPSTMAIEIVTISCAAECADVIAVASGGNPDYTFSWNDGVTTAERTVCPSATSTFTVTVTDTAITDGEFPYAGQTTTASVTANVIDCSVDGGVADAGPCDDSAYGLPDEITPDLIGTPEYFADGAELPAGRYRVSYVDGCMKYEGPWPWTVNGYAGGYEFVVFAGTVGDLQGTAPGVATSLLVAGTGYTDFEACVTASRALPPLEFELGGGTIGIRNTDFKTDDNSAGPRSPTWRLERICP